MGILDGVPRVTAPSATVSSAIAKGGLLTRLFGFGKADPREAEAAQGPLKILMARFGDTLPPEAVAVADALMSALQGIPGARRRCRGVGPGRGDWSSVGGPCHGGADAA